MLNNFYRVNILKKVRIFLLQENLDVKYEFTVKINVTDYYCLLVDGN